LLDVNVRVSILDLKIKRKIVGVEKGVHVQTRHISVTHTPWAIPHLW